MKPNYLICEGEYEESNYLLYREDLLKDCPQMAGTKRYYHLGIDITAPAKTPIISPFNGEIVVSEYEPGKGNYGGMIVIECGNNTEPIYILIGHLNPSKSKKVGEFVKEGEIVGELGNETCNGDWWPHAHVQVLTKRGFNEGWIYKGYCCKDEIDTISEFCLNPLFLLQS